MAPLPPAPAPTVDAIYAAYVAEADDGFRDHLGASIIGKDCERALWYDFRWVTRSTFSGRMLRLFDTGKREEDRLVRDLRRRVGAAVVDDDHLIVRRQRRGGLHRPNDHAGDGAAVVVRRKEDTEARRPRTGWS